MTKLDIENPDIPEDFDELPDGDGVILLSPRWRILSTNLQAERLLKTRLEHGQIFDLERFFVSDHKPKAELAIREAFQQGHSRSNLQGKIKVGNSPPIPISYSVFPIYDENRRLMGASLMLHDFSPATNGSAVGRTGGGPEYEALVDNLAEGMFTINNRWRITSFNQRAEAITGYNRSEVLGRYCWDIFQSALCRTGCPLRTTIETGLVRMDQDVRIVGKRGRRLSILVNTSTIKDKNDNIIGAVETFRPVAQGEQTEAVQHNGNGPVVIIGQSRALTRVLDMLPDIGASEASVILEGESGTGKELMARAIHENSNRSKGPFFGVNTSALAETLLESELFGHEKAAFTGAVNSKVGRFELARGGTLFLDEIAEIKPEIQVKLLRVIEERTFERVGGTRTIRMDARIICATNRNMAEEVKTGRFREDLFYRLRTVPVYLPALRDRTEDIPLLVDHFVRHLNVKYGKNIRGVDPKIMSMFQRYHWPGNVRELQRVLEYAFVFVKGPVITPSHLPELERPEPEESRSVSSESTIYEDERQAIRRALVRTGGRRQEAARLLGISRSSLWRKMKQHGINQ